MLPLIDPYKLVEVITRKAAATSQQVLAFWYSLTGPRENYAASILAACDEIPIIPLIPRRPGMFEAPNAMVSDLVQLIDESQSIIETIKGKERATKQPIIFLILSRSPLAIAGGCSPTPLPAWLPKVGGTIVNLEIEDLTFSADAPLNCKEAAVPTLCAALLALEMSLISRLKERVIKDPNSCQSFFSRIGQGEKPRDLIHKWERNVNNVKEPSTFRPSVKDGSSVVACLVQLFGKTAPDQLASVGESIGKDLWCELTEEASIVSVLFRPTQRHSSAYAIFGRNLLITVYAGYQYTTAAAHADGYPNFPISLIHVMSSHLSHTINDISELINETQAIGSDQQAIGSASIRIRHPHPGSD